MSDLISRSSLVRKIREAQASLETGDDSKWEMNKKYHSGLAWAHRLAVEEPGAERHGTWKTAFRFAPYQVCSVCGIEMPMVAGENVEEIRLYRYCPDCGARIDGGDRDERSTEKHGDGDA